MIQFIPEKIQTKITGVIVAICVIMSVLYIAIRPWYWIEPVQIWAQCLTILLCVFVFALICMIAVGVFMKEINKTLDDEETP